MDFLAKKITAPGILMLGLIAIYIAFGQWEKTILLLFLWLAAVGASIYDKLNTKDMTNICFCFCILNSMLISNDMRWYGAVLAVTFIFMNLNVIYNKVFIDPHANIVLMIVFMFAGSIITDYVQMHEIDGWFLIRLSIWGFGMIVISAIYKKDGEKHENRKDK